MDQRLTIRVKGAESLGMDSYVAKVDALRQEACDRQDDEAVGLTESLELGYGVPNFVVAAVPCSACVAHALALARGSANTVGAVDQRVFV
jgi:hypothetical protein